MALPVLIFARAGVEVINQRCRNSPIAKCASNDRRPCVRQRQKVRRLYLCWTVANQAP